MFARRALSTSAIRRADLIQQAFLKRVQEYGRVGGDLVNSDPAVKKALQEDLNRVAHKYNLTSQEMISKLNVAFETPKVEPSVATAFDGQPISKFIEEVKSAEKDFLAAQAARRAEEAKKAAALTAKN